MGEEVERSDSSCLVVRSEVAGAAIALLAINPRVAAVKAAFLNPVAVERIAVSGAMMFRKNFRF
jgi:hypothetical protein